MIVIGIETSGLSGSVALNRNGQCLESRSLDQVGRRHAQTLVLELQRLLAGQHLTPRDVKAVAVSRGPGSFTGLRVGLVCAKTFAYATGCQFVAVDTFAAVAMNCPSDAGDVWVVEDAQRGDLFAGRYHVREDGGWEQASPIEVVCAETWLPMRTADETITGRGLLRCDLSLTQARCLTGDDVIRPTASAVASRGERMLMDRQSAADVDFDFWKAVPFYIRQSAAEELREKQDAASVR